jgi:hypothetical protein
MVVDMEKRLTQAEINITSETSRADRLRDRVDKLELRICYLECERHDYRFMGRIDINKQYQGVYKVLNILLPDYRYTFLCSQCGHTLQLKAEGMSQQQRVALRKLGLLEEVPGDRKAQK